MGKVRQVCSLRISPELYAGLTRLAREKGTTITEQLERAVRGYLQQDSLDQSANFLRPQLGGIISDELDAKLADKFTRMQERLAALLAKVAVETGIVLFLTVSAQENPQKAYDEARAWAARNVRQKLPELMDVNRAAKEEVDALQGQLETATADADALRRQLEQEGLARIHAEKRGAKAQALVEYYEALERWIHARDQWVLAEHRTQGVIKRKPLEQLLQEFHHRRPRPMRPT